MYRIDIVTIFPEAITPYLNASILKRAQEKRRVHLGVHDLKQWGMGKRRTLDDKPYGGGPGMVLMLEPIYRSIQALKIPNLKFQIPNKIQTRNSKLKKPRTRVILTSAKGRPFTQRDAERYAKQYDRLVILCGHYEGVDERVAQHLADEEVSIGPYVLTGGELPALVIADAVTRLIPGVLGNAASPVEESYARSVTRHSSLVTRHSLEYPHYTRPADFSPKRGVHWRVPKVLLGGNHAAITAWRDAHRSR
ncbi:tRNA (guanosine(37)-N1)-methyltransferase TrmD [Candidatus Uhrbacteria bacterium]|nr:tRNA (guanosine(37)-N1)-methyltransferase TrmD [Candidatus Uhrbacteria bacterium]